MADALGDVPEQVRGYNHSEHDAKHDPIGQAGNEIISGGPAHHLSPSLTPGLVLGDAFGRIKRNSHIEISRFIRTAPFVFRRSIWVGGQYRPKTLPCPQSPPPPPRPAGIIIVVIWIANVIRHPLNGFSPLSLGPLDE